MALANAHEAERKAELARMRSAGERELASALADAERRGYAAGEERGEREAREQLQAQIDRVKALAVQLAQSKLRVLDDAEDGVVELAFAAVCRIIGDEGTTRAALARMVRAGMAGARERENVTVRMHPDDAALLRMGEQGPEPDIRVSADPSVALGGCIVDSGTGSLDSRIETQIAALGAALLAVRAARRQTGEAV